MWVTVQRDVAQLGPLPSLNALNPAGSLAARRIGPRPSDVAEMLAAVGSSHPRVAGRLLRARGRPRPDAAGAPGGRGRGRGPRAAAPERANANEVYTSMIGLGTTARVTPAVIQRSVLENPAWYAAYTPYQPEISQGRLEALINFQTMVADLTGLCHRRRVDARRGDRRRRGDDARPPGGPREGGVRLRRGRRHAAADPRRPRRPAPSRSASRCTSPTSPHGWPTDLPEAGAFGVLLSCPGASGAVRDHRALAAAAHEAGASVVVAADLLALTLLEAPGEWGADVACGTTQRFGVPHGLRRSARRLPVRPRGPGPPAARPPGAGVASTPTATSPTGSRCRPASSTSAARRRPATSAPRRCCWPSWPAPTRSTTGPTGLAAIAARVHRSAAVLAGWLRAGRLAHRARALLRHPHVAVPGRAAEVVVAAAERRINLRLVDADTRLGRLRRDDDRGDPPDGRRGLRVEPGGVRRRRCGRAAGRAPPPDAVPHPSGLLRAPLRDRDAALPARPCRTRTSRSTAR